MSEEAKKAIDTNPNEETIENIRVMVKRSLTFLKSMALLLKMDLLLMAVIVKQLMQEMETF